MSYIQLPLFLVAVLLWEGRQAVKWKDIVREVLEQAEKQVEAGIPLNLHRYGLRVNADRWVLFAPEQGANPALMLLAGESADPVAWDDRGTPGYSIEFALAQAWGRQLSEVQVFLEGMRGHQYDVSDSLALSAAYDAGKDAAWRLSHGA